MAAPDGLQPLRRDAVGDWSATLAAASVAGAVALRVVEPLHVLALRHGPGGAEAVAQALRPLGCDALPAAGGMVAAQWVDAHRLAAPGAAGPWVLWRSPSEWTLVGTGPEPALAVAQALRASGGDALAHGVDLSDGVVGLELQGPGVDDLLMRLLDAASIPRAAGQATRARLADVAVTLMRHEAQRVWLLADRSHDHYVAAWLAYAAGALAPAR